MAVKQKTDISMPEVLFTGGGDAAADRRVLRLAEQGQLRGLYQGVYTSNLASPPEAVVTRTWLNIVGHLLSGGVISYRSAHDAKPSAGRLYVTRGQRPRTIELPGLTVRVLPGPGAVTGDVAYKDMFLASQARWLLENMATGRGVGERVLRAEDLEAQLDKMLLIRGEHRFNELRENCRALVMRSRLDKNTGEWKDQNNQAGATVFVDHTLGQGTLREGFFGRLKTELS